MTAAKKVQLKNIRNFMKKLPMLMAEKAFLSFLAFFVLSLIISAVVFCQYNVAPRKDILETSQTSLRFKTDAYESILGTWSDKQNRLEKTDAKTYPNLLVR